MSVFRFPLFNVLSIATNIVTGLVAHRQCWGDWYRRTRPSGSDCRITAGTFSVALAPGLCSAMPLFLAQFSDDAGCYSTDLRSVAGVHCNPLALGAPSALRREASCDLDQVLCRSRRPRTEPRRRAISFAGRSSTANRRASLRPSQQRPTRTRTWAIAAPMPLVRSAAVRRARLGPVGVGLAPPALEGSTVPREAPRASGVSANVLRARRCPELEGADQGRNLTAPDVDAAFDHFDFAAADLDVGFGDRVTDDRPAVPGRRGQGHGYGRFLGHARGSFSWSGRLGRGKPPKFAFSVACQSLSVCI